MVLQGLLDMLREEGLVFMFLQKVDYPLGLALLSAAPHVQVFLHVYFTDS